MYRVVKGDTFELISRKQYGSEQYAANVAQANPGANEPLQPGTSLIIPANPASNENKPQQAESATPDEVALLIGGKRFRFWTSIRLTRSLDNMDTLDIAAPFEPQLESFKETFRPFSFKAVEVTVGGEPLFKGTMISVIPNLGVSKTIQVSAYSTPGVLNDCTAPASAYPLEYNSQSLKAITEAIIKPFGLTAVFTESPGGALTRVAMSPGQKILDFLADLAKQKNLVIASTERGELLFHKSLVTGIPVAKLQQGESPVLSVSPSFNPQEYYSHITGIEPVIVGLSGGVYTVKNGKLTDLLRPFTFQAQDSESGTLKEAVEAKAGRMFGNMVSYKVGVNTWRDPAGNLWKPNTLISLQSDNAMIYNPYTFVIRSVEFSRDENSQTATLDLVIPGSFSGAIPERLPWD
jgi:prophage tail gpP-like protein/phage tail protein X